MKRIIIALLILSLGLSLCACEKVDDYKAAVAMMDAGEYENAIAAFSALGNYKDSEQKKSECENILDYRQAISFMKIGSYEDAILIFDRLGDYKDSVQRMVECSLNLAYAQALSQMNAGNYEEARTGFLELGEYFDSAEKSQECAVLLTYEKAKSLFAAKKYDEAELLFAELDASADTPEQAQEYTNWRTYIKAEKLFAEEKYEAAYSAFTELGFFENASDQAKECEKAILYSQAVMLADEGNFAEALEAFLKVNKPYEYKDAHSYINLCETQIMLSDPLFSNIEKVMGMDFQSEDIEYGISKIGGTGIGPDALNIYFFPKNYQVLEDSCIFKMKGGSCLKLPMTYGELYQAGWWATSNEYGSSFSFVDAELEDTFPDDWSTFRLEFGNDCGEELLAKVGNPGSDSIILAEAQLERFDVSKDFDLNGITSESNAMDVLAQFGLPYLVEQVIYREDGVDEGSITFEYFGNPEERNGGYLTFSFDANTGILRNIGYALCYTTYHS